MKNEAAGSSKFASDLAPAAISNLQVVIPHRTAQLTRAALKYAASLSNDLNARIRLVDVYVVPYGVPLDEPPVNPKHLARKIRQLAQESAVPVSAEVVYARDWEQGFRRSLAARFACADDDQEILVAKQRQEIGGAATKNRTSSRVGRK